MKAASPSLSREQQLNDRGAPRLVRVAKAPWPRRTLGIAATSAAASSASAAAAAAAASASPSSSSPAAAAAAAAVDAARSSNAFDADAGIAPVGVSGRPLAVPSSSGSGVSRIVTSA